MIKKDYDVIVVGSGPNGLAAAIVLQQAGVSVLLIEGKETIGGGLRSTALTLPGYVHDVCSAIHPFAVCSPFFKSLPLEKHGLEYIFPKIAAAHPFDDGTAAALHHSIEETASSLGEDAGYYKELMTSLSNDWPKLLPFVMKPASFPSHPVALAKFGYYGITPVSHFVKKHFHNGHAQGLFAGMAAHGMQPLTNMATTAIALIFLLLGHTTGWPLPKGGSQQIANALSSYFLELGGKIETNFMVNSLEQLPSAHAVVFDLTPKQILTIAGEKFSSLYKWQMKRYRYGMGIFKIDWALDAPIPFTAPECRQAGTVHIGNTFDEVAASEQMNATGKISDKPFVLLTQSSLFDDTRAPSGKHTAWAYCHAPASSTHDMTDIIENQVERFAPGFKKLILARHSMNSAEMEAYNPNYIGGDIGGGIQDIGQLFTRPVLRFSPYKTSSKGIYICSSSTAPGGGVHGMCGYHAANKVLHDVFKIG
ncbi:MAG: NAD(P)/FAD-dependent oxidoreductase [Bacteroidetes bacterium]|nr:NAD(P)/FAD-dependent oxidoreductase [Bacteroidota bacterium]